MQRAKLAQRKVGDTQQKIIKSQVNKLAFFSCCPLPHLFSSPAFQAEEGGGCTWPGGRGDAHGRGGGGMHVHPPWVRHCMEPYAGVDYNFPLCPLQRVNSFTNLHIYHGQPYNKSRP
jgi:hypothetical protein